MVARAILAFAAMLPAAAGTADPVADFYRTKTVEMIIGAAAGGGYDIADRAVARHIGRTSRVSPA
jgi:tripartite-type tricarboxylate transporter receptor subunit TctC